MISLYQLLQKIKERPGMYIGYPSVSDLFMFLCGYKRACQDMGLPLSDEEEEFHEFQPWLQKKLALEPRLLGLKLLCFMLAMKLMRLKCFLSYWKNL
ncbi:MULTISPECIES: hypothetical protein [Oscillatoriales]|uniref:hypothetical protein n=1 Tax=Oscillatoriophycideae TaxID=1301283 RepID=UPI0018F02419|nr:MULTISPECIES: hypothetical protein [Oscillatoriales]